MMSMHEDTDEDTKELVEYDHHHHDKDKGHHHHHHPPPHHHHHLVRKRVRIILTGIIGISRRAILALGTPLI